MKIRTELIYWKKKFRMKYRTYSNILITFEYPKNIECSKNSLSQMEPEIESRESDFDCIGIDFPFAIISPISQIIILNQSDLPSEEKTDNALTLLNQISNSDTLSDKEKIEAFIYFHQKMDMEEWLLPVVKEFIHFSVEKMKLYLIQRNHSHTRQMVDLQSYVVLINPFQSKANEIEFQGWPEIEKEQASFHKWLAKVRAKGASLEQKDYEIEDFISNI